MHQSQFFAIALIKVCSCSRMVIALLSLTIIVNGLATKLVNANPLDRDFPRELIAQAASEQKPSPDSTTINYSNLEQEILAQINQARTDPIAYSQWLESTKKYFEGSQFKLPGEKQVITNKGLENLNEAIVFLKNLQPLEAVNRTEELSQMARDRIAEAANQANNVKINPLDDNLSYGKQTAQGIVMQLIVDDGVRDRRHRHNIFNPNARATGVACGENSTYKNMCLITFSDQNTATTKLTSNPTRPLNTPKSPPTPTVVPAASPQLILSKNGSLAAGDAKLADDGSLYDFYPLKGSAGEVFTIEVSSVEFDPFVAAIDSTGKTIAQNDDISDRDSNCRLELKLPKDGEYRIVINSYQEQGRGKYLLHVKKF